MMRVLGVDIQIRGKVPEGLALVVSNHRSYLDIPALLTALSGIFLSKSEVARWPVFGPAARLQDTIFVERSCSDSRRAAREEVGRRLDAGVTVIGFPEGTTCRGPGKLPFAPGLFTEAEKRGVPVVPATIEYHDLDDCWVETESFVAHYLRCFQKPRVGVTVAFGEPLFATSPGETRILAEAWVEQSLVTINETLERSRGTCDGYF
jgi:1-acyl-sn-glycerol-3-phosphate acyltransferase